VPADLVERYEELTDREDGRVAYAVKHAELVGLALRVAHRRNVYRQL
jgi:hypothetical protein